MKNEQKLECLCNEINDMIAKANDSGKPASPKIALILQLTQLMFSALERKQHVGLPITDEDVRKMTDIKNKIAAEFDKHHTLVG